MAEPVNEQGSTSRIRREEHRLLALAEIQVDAWVRARKTVEPSKIADILGAITDGVTIPPPVVFEDQTTRKFWLGDGADRIAAYKQNGTTSLDCVVMTGTKRDAFIYSLEANGRHGERLTLADRKANARQMLLDIEWSGSARMIAELCGLSDKTVSAIRDAMISTAEIPRSAVVTSKDGRKRPAKRRPGGGSGVGNKRDQKSYKVDKASGFSRGLSRRRTSSASGSGSGPSRSLCHFLATTATPTSAHLRASTRS